MTLVTQIYIDSFLIISYNPFNQCRQCSIVEPRKQFSFLGVFTLFLPTKFLTKQYG